MDKLYLILTVINLIIATVFIILIKRGGLKMLMMTVDNPVVCAWYTAVKLYGYTLEQVPTAWNLKSLVKQKLDEDKEKEN